jgi:hypothetical protein
MSYLIYNGKMLQQSHKYLTKITAPEGPINRLTSWTNVSFDTLVAVGTSINSAIEAPGTYGRAVTNSYPLLAYGFTPTQWGVVNFRYFYTKNSGNIVAECFLNGSSQGTQSSGYTGPQYYQGGWLIGSSGNITIQLISADSLGCDFSAINCELFITNGLP